MRHSLSALTDCQDDGDDQTGHFICQLATEWLKASDAASSTHLPFHFLHISPLFGALNGGIRLEQEQENIGR